MVVLRRLSVAATLLALAGCRPDLGDRASLVDGPRVLAVRSVPAEAEARDAVRYSALVVDAAGERVTGALDWALCNARKPLAELEPVNPVCIARAGDFLVPLGQGSDALATVPSAACRLFGPEVPPPKAGEAYGRPADPDPSGGYYQPLRVLLTDVAGDVGAIGSTRLACGVAGASSGDASDFLQRYHLNENPAVVALSVDGVAAGEAAISAPAGAALKLEVSWPVCPTQDACGDGLCGPDETRAGCEADCAAPAGCGGSERYVYYDTADQRLVVRRESMRVSWFATGGVFGVDTTGRDEADLSSTSSNTLTLPAAPGQVRGWVVLRDSRGGSAWSRFAIDAR